MVHIIDVPGFSGVLIHGGTTEKSTLGCVLAAYNKDEAKGTIQGTAAEKIKAIVKEQTALGVEMFITIN
jgi:hypothetical protein